MDAVEVIKAFVRMCELSICTKCPLGKDNNSKNLACYEYRRHFPEKYVATIEEWAQEHPVKTKKQKFLELFKPDILNKWHIGCKDECDTSAPPCNYCAWWDEEYKGE